MIQITLAFLSDATSTLLGGLFQDLKLLQGLESGAGNTSGTTVEVGGSGSTALATTINLGQSTNTDSSAEVDVTSDGSSTHVEPVGIIGSQLLVSTGLDKVDPLRDFQLARTLQKGSVGGDKLLSRNVFDSSTTS